MTKKTKTAKPMSELDKALHKAKAKRVKYNNAHKAYVQEHQDIYDDIRYLTIGFLIEDLKSAKKYAHGYFKNANGVYIHVKGFEVDGTCDLLRGGYNAEDHGVYVHYAYVDEHECTTQSVTMSTFENLFSDWQSKTNKFYRTSKESFDNAVKAFVHKALEPYEERHSIQEYLDFMQTCERYSIAIAKTNIELLELEKQRHSDDKAKLKNIQQLIDMLKERYDIELA